MDDAADGQDDSPADIGRPDAHGQAALLLVESLIHGLIARAAITVAEAVEIVDIAAEAKAEMEVGQGGAEPLSRSAVDILESISRSLRIDLGR